MGAAAGATPAAMNGLVDGAAGENIPSYKMRERGVKQKIKGGRPKHEKKKNPFSNGFK